MADRNHSMRSLSIRNVHSSPATETAMQEKTKVVACPKTNKAVDKYRPTKLALSVARNSSRMQFDRSTLEFKSVGLAVMNFIDFLIHPEQKYEKTTLQYLEGLDNDKIIQLNQLLSTSLKDLPSTRKIHSKSLYYGLLADETTFLELFGSFDPEILKDVRIKMLKLTKEGWETVASTDQWKKAESVVIEVENLMPIVNFFEKTSFYTIVKEMSTMEAAFLLRAFVIKERVHGSFFYVRSEEPLDFKEILKNGGWEEKNEPVTSPWKAVLHTQRFTLPREDLVLVVIFMENELTGKICKKTSINEDCLSYYSKYFFD